MSFKIKIGFLVLLNLFSFSYGLCSPEDHGRYYSVEESDSVVSDTTIFVFQVLLLISVFFIIKLIYNRIKIIKAQNSSQTYRTISRKTEYNFKCKYCKDTGGIEEKIYSGEGGFERIFKTCNSCQGTGWDLEKLPLDMCRKVRNYNGDIEYVIDEEVYNKKYKRPTNRKKNAIEEVSNMIEGKRDGLYLCPKCKGLKFIKRDDVIEGFDPSKGTFYITYRFCPYCEFGKSFISEYE